MSVYWKKLADGHDHLIDGDTGEPVIDTRYDIKTGLIEHYAADGRILDHYPAGSARDHEIGEGMFRVYVRNKQGAGR